MTLHAYLILVHFFKKKPFLVGSVSPFVCYCVITRLLAIAGFPSGTVHDVCGVAIEPLTNGMVPMVTYGLTLILYKIHLASKSE